MPPQNRAPGCPDLVGTADRRAVRRGVHRFGILLRLLIERAEDPAADAVTEIANGLLENSESLTFEAREWLMHSSACRAAIKAGHKASRTEMVSLAEQILCGDVPKYCPHGRPVYITMSKNEIEKRFGRIV